MGIVKEHLYCISVNDVDHVIKMEGLDYALEHYVNAQRIEDDKLRALWINARIALHELTTYIKENASKQ